MASSPVILLCLTTVSDQAQARQLAADALAKRLAACVQIDGPIESHYRWNGKLCCEPEYRVLIKTSLDRHAALQQWLIERHPYQQPQIVFLRSSDVETGYAQWVNAETTVLDGEPLP